ncbi:MAG: ribosome recycling factor [Patescibacteria group bacterium]|nr:ribosome recycling factor [Patescibacteria group bacterium]
MSYEFSNFKKECANVEEWLRKEFQQIRTGMASPAILDAVTVEAYGTPMSLKEVASVNIEGARTLRIVAWDKGQLKAIEKSLIAANLGLSVVVDDVGIRVNFPELTAERRKEIAKTAKEKLEDARKQVRSSREEIIKDIQNKERDGDIGKDDAFRAKNDLQKLVDEANKRLDELFAKKEKEIVG